MEWPVYRMIDKLKLKKGLKYFCLILILIVKTGSFYAQSLMVADFENENAVSTPEVLLFQSGFEGSTSVIPYGSSTNDQIVGKDQALLSSDWDDLRTNLIRTMYINYAGGDKTQRHADIITDPTNANNKVLHYYVKDFWLTEDGQEKARCQIEFYDIKNGLKEFYQSVRVYLTESFNVLKTRPNGMPWFTIAEFWNDENWNSPYGFRISVGLYKDGGGTKDLNFTVTGQDSNIGDIWSVVNNNVVVPIGKWFTLDYYFREGNKDTGRFYMAITPDGQSKEIICDIHDYTHAVNDPSPDGLTGYNPMKLYTSKDIMSFMEANNTPLEIYWDDLKLWKNKRP